MPFREWIHSGGSNLEEMENGGGREEEGTVNDTDLCRGRVPNRGTRKEGALCAALRNRPLIFKVGPKVTLLHYARAVV